MYNYFMLIGIVENFNDGDGGFYIKLRVDRMFGKGIDHFKIRVIDNNLVDIVKETVFYNTKLCIKGRLVQTDDKLELTTEQIIFL